MSAEENIDYSKSFSCEEVLAQAKWYHEDLQKEGWREIHNEGNKATFWMKNFPSEAVPTKFLMKYRLPLSAEQFNEVSNPKNMKFRHKWDKGFVGNEIIEEYPDGGGYLICNRVEMPWPICDREFLLFTTPAIEVEWYGKQAYLIPYINASHKSKPANAGSYVRVTNGGQFVIVMPDEVDPNHACTLFGLSNNLYNGYLSPKYTTWLFARAVPTAFINFYDSVVEGHNMFFADKA